MSWPVWMDIIKKICYFYRQVLSLVSISSWATATSQHRWGHDDGASRIFSKVEVISTFPILTGTSTILRGRRRHHQKTFSYHGKYRSSIADPLSGTRPRHLRWYENMSLLAFHRHTMKPYLGSGNARVPFQIGEENNICFSHLFLYNTSYCKYLMSE